LVRPNGVVAVAKVRQGQFTVAGAAAGQKFAALEPEPARRRERTAPAARPRQIDLDELLITLDRRAPAPSVGPSHWWG
jgi:hypothetical protein